MNKRKNIIPTKESAPSLQTVAEVYAEDEGFIQTVCKELNIQAKDLLFTLEEIHHYNTLETNIQKITVMDFTNTTLEDELCKLNSQY